MKIGIIGATGKAGSHLAQEAQRQGHAVTAIVRNKAKIADSGLSILERDLFDLTAADIEGFDSLIDAFNAPRGKEEQHQTSLRHLIDVCEQRPEVRLLVVGGAGSLYTDAERKTRVFETPDFPGAFLPTAANMAGAFDLLRSSDVIWSYLSPAIEFDPNGARTGSYALGDDVVILNKAGESYVSYADYAVAMIDEIKNKAYIRRRFCVVSERG